MTAATKISFCVDCATPIIGGRLRCPACRDQHAVVKATLAREAFVAWLGAALIIIIAAILLMVAGRSCQ